ncbi:MAG: hypothetical protein HC888_11020 [Candidatus Competibacteraceae bacterium]|nr:hypothetical protein [Candidatus Competibacteraceae bacterium]
MIDMFLRGCGGLEAAGAYLGVGIREVRPGEVHVGLIYRSFANDLQFLHLAWQDDLRLDTPSGTYFYAACDIDSTNAFFLSMMAESVARVNVGRKINWGWTYEGSSALFDTHGNLSDERAAMTCASFILGLFVTYGMPIVRPETWPSRLEDKLWALDMLGRLSCGGEVSAQNLEHLSSAISGMTRVRPTEVAVAAAGIGQAKPPFCYDEIQSPSEQLKCAITERKV